MFSFIDNLNLFINFKMISSEELIIIFLFYNFIKILIFNGLFELIWPTHFFNRRHTINTLKFRNISEVLTKLINMKNYYNVFNIKFIDYYLSNK